ncbi:hypothetical protein BGY98DRAFT_419038 [Russula aff. rugulosa BPL654]|nr:hypothetical protein BGY98DRAFT_419038 [Russula aff. rugulosa BPL654]
MYIRRPYSSRRASIYLSIYPLFNRSKPSSFFRLSLACLSVLSDRPVEPLSTRSRPRASFPSSPLPLSSPLWTTLPHSRHQSYLQWWSRKRLWDDHHVIQPCGLAEPVRSTAPASYCNKLFMSTLHPGSHSRVSVIRCIAPLIKYNAGKLWNIYSGRIARHGFRDYRRIIQS